MPKLPPNNYYFRDRLSNPSNRISGRMKLDHVYRDQHIRWEEMGWNEGGADQAIANDRDGQELFLGMLDRMLKEEGAATDVRKLFTDAGTYFVDPKNRRDRPNLYGSQVLLSLHTFDETHNAKKRSSRLGPPETSTHYGYSVAFFPLLDRHGTDRQINTAHFALDPRPMELLCQYSDGGKKETDACSERYYQGFMKMAMMAEHDYIHQLISLTRPYSKSDFLPRSLDARGGKNPDITSLEKYAVTLHAQICHRLFSEVKTNADGQEIKVGERRKDRVLEWAADQMKLLADMQNEALAHAPQWRHPQLCEAVTYLTEIYAHRLFRVISPLDDDLKKPITLRKSGMTTSVAAECARLKLDMTPAWKAGKPERDPGLESLQELCELYHHDLYVRAHETQSVKLNAYAVLKIAGMEIPVWKGQPELSLPGAIARFAQEGLAPMIAAKEKHHAQTLKDEKKKDSGGRDF